MLRLLSVALLVLLHTVAISAAGQTSGSFVGYAISTSQTSSVAVTVPGPVVGSLSVITVWLMAPVPNIPVGVSVADNSGGSGIFVAVSDSSAQDAQLKIYTKLMISPPSPWIVSVSVSAIMRSEMG